MNLETQVRPLSCEATHGVNIMELEFLTSKDEGAKIIYTDFHENQKEGIIIDWDDKWIYCQFGRVIARQACEPERVKILIQTEGIENPWQVNNGRSVCPIHPNLMGDELEYKLHGISDIRTGCAHDLIWKYKNPEKLVVGDLTEYRRKLHRENDL